MLIFFLRLQSALYKISISGSKTSPQGRMMTRSNKDDTEEASKTFAILKNVTATNKLPEETKENKKDPLTPPKPDQDSSDDEKKRESPYNIFPPSNAGADFALSKSKTEKGYKCPKCQRAYNARRNLVRHVTLECGREPQYKCPFCAYSKHRRNELKNHINKKHPNQKALSVKWARARDSGLLTVLYTSALIRKTIRSSFRWY